LGALLLRLGVVLKRQKVPSKSCELQPLVRSLARSSARLALDNYAADEPLLSGTTLIDAAPFLTVKEVALLFRVSERTVRNWIKNRQLETRRIGGVIRIARSELDRAMRAQI
jgi:excisionase family DNA binding protein